MFSRMGFRPNNGWADGLHVVYLGGDRVAFTYGRREIEILAETGTHLAHSPVANMKMATGILPLTEVQGAGVNVGLGTDGALNNNSYDMFAEMKAACLLQNATQRRADALTPETALEMATINGARAIGREQDLGSLEAGKQADIVLLDMQQPETLPLHNVVSSIVFATSSRNVRDVYIGGRQVVAAGAVTGVSEQELVSQAQSYGDALRENLDLKPATDWPVE